MPRWTPEPAWQGCDVFIIGGGSSLDAFDYSLLHDECTIGCNSHFLKGPRVSKLCIFGDYPWYLKHKNELEIYSHSGGVVFTNALQLQRGRIPKWLWTMERSAWGMHKDSLGWNDNTGASAINLALLLGATRIYLLGFDMCTIKESHTCHADYPKEPRKNYQQVFEKHCSGLKRAAADLSKFPDQEVINVSDVSELTVFPKISFQTFWAKRERQAC